MAPWRVGQGRGEGGDPELPSVTWTAAWGRCCVSYSACAAVTKYYRPGGLNKGNLFLTVLGSELCEAGVPAWPVLVGAFFLACRWLLWTHMAEKEGALVDSSPYETTNFIMRDLPS